MPTIEISINDLNVLAGTKISQKQLQDHYALLAKGEVEEIGGDKISIDIKDTNRPDLWSTEGIAREIKGRNTSFFPEYSAANSGITVQVDPRLEQIRPYAACAVVRNLRIDDATLSQMIQLQDKISLSFGRNRSVIAVGAYDMQKIKPPIRYTVTAPAGIRFPPLGFSSDMTPREILARHQKGKEFGHLLKGVKNYPIFIDAENKVLSMPPIINSEHTGKVSKSTRDVFIECTGFNQVMLSSALNVLVTALGDRGGSIETVEVDYAGKKVTTPNLLAKETTVSQETIGRLSGLSLDSEQIRQLLEKSLYRVKKMEQRITVEYPCYRQDIMHEADVAEDVIITYGYNKITPSPITFYTKGTQPNVERVSVRASSALIGAGFQEVLSYTLTSKDSLFSKMNVKPSRVAEIRNPVSKNWSVFRNSLIPGLLEFLSRNRHREFPQKIFEVGDLVLLNNRAETRAIDSRRIAAAISDTSAAYHDCAEALEFLFSSMGRKYGLKGVSHPSFIPGRVATISSGKRKIGIIGEIHPQVLNNWSIEIPTVCIEMSLDQFA